MKSRKESQRTKDVKKRYWIFRIASVICWLGVALFAVISAFSKVGGSNKTGVEILSDEFKSSVISLSITVLIGLVIAIIIKEKARVAIYMFSLVIVSIIYKEVAMYIVLGVWGLDEYLFTALAKKYKQLATINKEIDLRG